MRVLWLCPQSHLGGATLASAEEMDSLTRRVHDVDVLLPDDGSLRERLKLAHSVSIEFSNRWEAQSLPPWVARLRQAAFDLCYALPKLKAIAHKYSPDVIVSNT